MEAQVATELEPEIIEAVEPEVEVSEDDEMGAAFDRLTANVERDESGRFKSAKKDEPEAEEAEAEEVEAESAEPEVEAESTEPGDEAPNYLPRVVKEQWANIPKEAREAFAASQREMSERLTQAGRTEKALQPILSEIQRATQQFPELANKRPEEVARDVFELAHTRANLQRDPVGTILQVAQQMGKVQELAARFGQQAPQTAQVEAIRMRQEIADLKSRLERQPDDLRQMVSQEMSVAQHQRMINEFAAQQEHWAQVEPTLPQFISALQSLPNGPTSAEDTLRAAYDMALNALGLRAKEPAPVTVAATNPQKVANAVRAKSVNVASSAGKPKPMTEDEAMSAAYDKLMRSN